MYPRCAPTIEDLLLVVVFGCAIGLVVSVPIVPIVLIVGGFLMVISSLQKIVKWVKVKEEDYEETNHRNIRCGNGRTLLRWHCS